MAAEHHGKGDHASGQKNPTTAVEHSGKAHEKSGGVSNPLETLLASISYAPSPWGTCNGPQSMGGRLQSWSRRNTPLTPRGTVQQEEAWEAGYRAGRAGTSPPTPRRIELINLEGRRENFSRECNLG